MTTWSGCGIKDPVVIVDDDYDNDDHVIAAVLKLRLYVYMYAHAERARHVCTRGATWGVGTGGAKETAPRRLTSISIETAHTRSGDREHARREWGKGQHGARAYRVER